MKLSKLDQRESKILKAIPEAQFKDGVLISPLPTVKFGHKIRTEHEFIEKAFIKYSFESVIQAMKNKKIILVL
jgi:hypothetical protein